MTYAELVASTPQTMKASPGQVKNSAGGYSFALGDWDRLDRFLILGTMGGTYYASERKLTQENAQVLEALIREDGVRFVNRVAEISESGRAHKNDHALFALALASVKGDVQTRQAAYEALPRVARIPTFLFKFLNERQGLGGGWGRGLRNAVAKIYEEKDLGQLAYHVIKYRQREGWTHRDVLRKAHPESADDKRDNLFRYIVQGEYGDLASQDLPEIIAGYEWVNAHDVEPSTAAHIVREHNLPREALPTEFLTEAVVWDALLDNMPVWAMVRNLRNMGRVGLLTPGSDAEKRVVSTLQDEDAIRKSRIHPMHLLLAIGGYGGDQYHPLSYGGYRHGRAMDNTYASGSVLKALDDAFYVSFGNVQPTGKRVLAGIDVSGSMSGITDSGLSCSTLAGAMAMVSVRSEDVADMFGFDSGFKDLGIKKTDTLQSVVKKIANKTYGGTDCSLPMQWALQGKREYDAFIVYTDNETWAGSQHPHQALNEYRRKMGIPAKMVVVGITSTGFSIADPNDAGMLDVVGFDAGAPTAIAEFLGD